MSASYVLLLVFLIGLFSGLRSLTPTAVTAWAARLGWLKLGSGLTWLGTTPAAVIFTVLAIVELVNDKLPKTPSRTAPVGLTARICHGRFHGCVRGDRGRPGTRAGRDPGDCRRACGHVRRLSGSDAFGEGARHA